MTEIEEPVADLTLSQCTLGDHWAKGKVRPIVLRTYDVAKEGWDERRVTACAPCYSTLQRKAKES